MFPRNLILLVAAESHTDARSVEAELNGRRVRGQAGNRIRAALARRRLISVGDAPAQAGTALSVIEAEAHPGSTLGITRGRPF
jgi:hypothetical protein